MFGLDAKQAQTQMRTTCYAHGGSRARACEIAGRSAETDAERSERWNDQRHCGWPRSATTYLPHDEDGEDGLSTFRPKAQSPQYPKC